MKKTFDLVITTKEALELLGNVVPKSLSKRLIKAIQEGNTYPKGALAAAKANATKSSSTKKAAPKKTAETSGVTAQ